MRDKGVELPRSVVPCHGRIERDGTAIVHIPTDARDFARFRVKFDDGIPGVGSDARITIAVGKPRDAGAAKYVEGLWVGFLQKNSGPKAIDEDGLAASGGAGFLRPLVREHMEGLQSSWLREVGSICVGSQGLVCVGSVVLRQISREVVEAAVVCIPDRTNFLEKLLSGFCAVGRNVLNGD